VPSQVEEFASILNIPPILSQILLFRGIDSFDSAKQFFRPDYQYLHDPFLMKDMDVAVDRIVRSIELNEKILIYGDYDVDGVTSVSLLYLFLKSLGATAFYYIPDRQTEGYGLSKTGIEYAKRREINLIISVDCGITSIDEAELIRKLGMDLIINDHHEPGQSLPKAVAVLDPKRPDCGYPFKELAAVGVVFKFATGIISKLGKDELLLRDYIDLVAIGSAADIVPLVDENRILVKYGLDYLNDEKKRVGVQALLTVIGLRNRQLTTGQIIFGLAPRINAAGRLGDAKRAVKLLTTDNRSEADEISLSIENMNKTRREIDETTFYEAQCQVEEQYDLHYDRSIVLYNPDWHVGVIGIVASRIVEKYYRPTVMITNTDGIGKASARSIRNFNLYEAFTECSDLLTNYGGHKYAAGMTIETQNISEFRKRMNRIAKDKLDKDDLIPILHIEGKMLLNEIDGRMVRLLKLFEPFGPNNMRPVFISEKVEIVTTPVIVGNNHLKFNVRQNGCIIDAIGFGLGNLRTKLTVGKECIDIAYQIEENEWQGKKRLQLRIKDIKNLINN